jgi:hypothetical protein
MGSLGALAAKVIQASVSRQREFLADASAVQFTRNPEGIANALRRLGSRSTSTKVRHPRAQESAHMFFGEALKLSASLATHPPLKERIKRINPQWDGTFLPPLETSTPEPEPTKQSAQDRLRDQLNKRMGAALPDALTDAVPDAIQHAALLTPLLALSGTMSPAHIDHARTIIQSIPEPLKEAAHDISSARAVVYALLLDRNDARVYTQQIHHLLEHADPAVAKLTDHLSSHATRLEPHLRLPLLDMTLASLAHLSDQQHETFQKNVSALVYMDKSIDLFEWVTIKVLTRHLNQRFGLTTKVPVQYYTLKSVMTEVSTLLSVIAYTDTASDTEAADSITLANTALPSPDATLLPKDNCTLDTLSAALDTLNTVTPRLKRSLLEACALTAAHDHNITTTEAELIRAIADTLSIPVPLLLPNQRLDDSTKKNPA